jgi:hypothetical protein
VIYIVNEASVTTGYYATTSIQVHIRYISIVHNDECTFISHIKSVHFRGDKRVQHGLNIIPQHTQTHMQKKTYNVSTVIVATNSHKVTIFISSSIHRMYERTTHITKKRMENKKYLI